MKRNRLNYPNRHQREHVTHCGGDLCPGIIFTLTPISGPNTLATAKTALTMLK